MIRQNFFEKLKDRVLNDLKPGEHAILHLAAETTQFLRFSKSLVRQVGTAENAALEISLIQRSPENELRKASHSLTLSGALDHDEKNIRSAMQALRQDLASLPVDPFAEVPRHARGASATSTVQKSGKLLSTEEAPDAILETAQGLDLAGIYAAGTVVRALATSEGQNHWFSSESYSLDFSAYTPSQRAVKAVLAGAEWDPLGYAKKLSEIREKIPLLERAPKRVPPGTYRVYLAAAALENLISMLSWGGVSEASIRQAESPLRFLRNRELSLATKLQLSEDFTGGESPRFTPEGELAPERLPLIQNGQLVNALVNGRTAKEYGIPSNGAHRMEMMRAPSVAAGSLQDEDILATLGTGLYLSDLHYLNWSDQPGGRVTGMTRYACFWVEDGQLIAPIENLRFDDTIFRLLGTEVVEFGAKRSFLPDTSTYHHRAVGGAWMPGVLVQSMRFTL